MNNTDIASNKADGSAKFLNKDSSNFLEYSETAHD